MEVVDALRALGGTARWKQLRGHVSWRSIKRARATGQVGVRGSTYFVLDTPADRVLARRLRAVRSHETAAAHWGFALPPDQQTTRLTVPPNAHRSRAPDEVRLCYRRMADDERVDDVTTPLRTVVDCLRDSPLPVALSVGDSALRTAVVTRAELERAVAGLTGRGCRRARQRVALLDARAANAFESCARAILLAAGIPGFEPQVPIRHAGYFVGVVDLANRERRIVVECDGFEFHSDRAAFAKDLVRFTLLVAAGWRPLRFTWEQVMFRPEWLRERVRDVLALTGAVPEDSTSIRAAGRAA